MTNAENRDHPLDMRDETVPVEPTHADSEVTIGVAQTIAHVLLGRDLTVSESSAVCRAIDVRVAIETSIIRARLGNTVKPEKAVPEKLTPPQLAAHWGVSPDKILAWIRSGELTAMNAASSTSTRPRYLIDPTDIATFEKKRSAQQETPRRKARKHTSANVTEFF